MEGSLSEPVAHTSTGAPYSSPPVVRTTQRALASSQRASSTARPKRRCSPTSKRSTHPRM